ncbi:Hypothetical protein SCF082_LOCUS27668, partial [Durusdinium trenchii]
MGCCSSTTSVQKTHSLGGLTESCSFDFSRPAEKGVRLPPAAVPQKGGLLLNQTETTDTSCQPLNYEVPKKRRSSSTSSKGPRPGGNHRQTASEGSGSFLLQGVHLDRSQFMRLPAEAPLRILLGLVEIRDRWLEPNVEIACEIRLFQPRTTLTLALFPESSYAESKVSATIKGEVKGPHSTWHIGEELAFEGDAVRQERRSEGGLQAQVLLIERPSGDKLAATSHFKVPTSRERHEPLWSRGTFTQRRVGHVSVAAGW